MSRTKRLGIIAASALMSVGALLGFSAIPASASPNFGPAVTSSCAADVVVGITSSHYYLIWDGVTWFHDGPGGMVTGHVERQAQVSATISYGADITLNDLVASVKASINNSATRSVTTTIGHSYSHSIPANKFGNLKYGAWGYAVSWVKEYRHSNCTITVLGRGTGRVPTKATGWYYYNTNS
jgi:hypothetical protein